MMYDIKLPNIQADNLIELSKQVNTVLYILSNGIGDALNNISTDNISAELLGKLKAVGIDITLDESKIKSHFVSSVTDSEEFKAAIKTIINTQTGG